MIDIQALIDAIGASGRVSRQNYHVSLGQLRALVAENPDGNVIVDGSGGLDAEHSYRGYYDDLSFEPVAEPTPAAEVLAMCERALSQTYEGYKGGDYTYSDDTPLWRASYGCCGRAIVGAEVRDGDVHLTTKDLDA